MCTREGEAESPEQSLGPVGVSGGDGNKEEEEEEAGEVVMVQAVPALTPGPAWTQQCSLLLHIPTSGGEGSSYPHYRGEN